MKCAEHRKAAHRAVHVEAISCRGCILQIVCCPACRREQAARARPWCDGAAHRALLPRLGGAGEVGLSSGCACTSIRLAVNLSSCQLSLCCASPACLLHCCRWSRSKSRPPKSSSSSKSCRLPTLPLFVPVCQPEPPVSQLARASSTQWLLCAAINSCASSAAALRCG